MPRHQIDERRIGGETIRLDDKLSVEHHSALFVTNHATGARSLLCDDCGQVPARFEGPVTDEQLAEVWAEHLKPWCAGIRIPAKDAAGRYVPAACGSTTYHGPHWMDGRDWWPEVNQ